MQEIFGRIKKRAAELFADGTVTRMVGWQKGESDYDKTPAVFGPDMKGFVYDGFCGANLSKYLINLSKEEGRTLVLLKPCDSYSFNQLLTEHRIDRDKVYAIGIDCSGKLDINKIRALGVKGIRSVAEEGDEVVLDTVYGPKRVKRSEVLLDRCYCCKGKDHVAGDEFILAEKRVDTTTTDRFELVKKLEAMTPDERYEFWRGELSRCIRCNACRNVCPACSCVKCVFDNPALGTDSKANSDTFEENMFHIIRAFHVAGRCTDCGECSRVCPQHIPLHLLNRKFIRDIDELYGEYQAGAEVGQRGPLTDFAKNDAEPGATPDKGGKK